MHEHSFWANPRTWVGVAFVLFVVIFGRRIWAVLAKVLDDHSARIRTELEEASRLRREAEQMLHDAEQRREAALRDAQQMIESAKAEAGRVAAAAGEEIEASSRRREQMAHERIAAAEKAALDDVRLTAVEVATSAAHDVIAQNLPAEADAGLIDRAISQLPAALSTRRAA